MKLKLIFAAAIYISAVSTSFHAWSADTAQEFVRKAAIGGMFEVASSEVAVSKAGDESIRNFAQTMIDDHGTANARLAEIAASQQLEVPRGLDADHQRNLDALTNTSGMIDEPYLRMQRQAHVDAVQLFEGYSLEGDNAPLKTFATETLPTLKMHLQMVEAMASGADHSQGTTSTTPSVDASGNAAVSPPLEGENSFTEDQARERIQAAGYEEVTALAKDEQGIWRGEAVRNGSRGTVALDFQGNVVGTAK